MSLIDERALRKERDTQLLVLKIGVYSRQVKRSMKVIFGVCVEERRLDCDEDQWIRGR